MWRKVVYFQFICHWLARNFTFHNFFMAGFTNIQTCIKWENIYWIGRFIFYISLKMLNWPFIKTSMTNLTYIKRAFMNHSFEFFNNVSTLSSFFLAMTFQGATKLCFTHYMLVVIILFKRVHLSLQFLPILLQNCSFCVFFGSLSILYVELWYHLIQAFITFVNHCI